MTAEAEFFDRWMQAQPVPASDGRCDGCGCPTGAAICGDCSDRLEAGLPLHEANRIRCDRTFGCRGKRGRYERCNVCGRG